MKTTFHKYINIVFSLFAILLIARLRFWDTNVAEGKSGDFSILVYFTRVIPFLSVFICLLYLDIRQKLIGFRHIFKNILLSAVFLYIAVSIFNCAVVAKSNYSLWRTIEILIILYAAAVMKSLKIQELATKRYLVHKYMKIILMLMMTAFVSACIFPDSGWKQFQLFGVIPSINANTFGFLILGMMLYTVIVKPWPQRYHVPLLFLLLFMFIAAKSRTSFIAAVFIISLYLLAQFFRLIVYQRIKRMIFVIFSVIALVIMPIIVLSLPTVVEFVTKGQDSKELTEMSGRIFKWTHATFSIKSKPLFGYGLVVETRQMALKYKNILEHKTWGGGYGNVHNFVLEALLASGIVGAGPYILLFYSFCIAAIANFFFLTLNENQDSLYIFTSAFLVTMIFRSFTGSNLAYNGWEFSILLFLYAINSFPWQKK